MQSAIEDYVANGPIADSKALAARISELNDALCAKPEQAAAAAAAIQTYTELAAVRSHGSTALNDDLSLPRVNDKIRSVYASLGTDTPRTCTHLTPTATSAAVCVDEPWIVLCSECITSHGAKDHTREWDDRCSECGRVDMRGTCGLNITPVLGAPIRFTTGVELFLSPVIITGLAICERCRLSAGQKRTRSQSPTS